MIHHSVDCRCDSVPRSHIVVPLFSLRLLIAFLGPLLPTVVPYHFPFLLYGAIHTIYRCLFESVVVLMQYICCYDSTIVLWLFSGVALIPHTYTPPHCWLFPLRATHRDSLNAGTLHLRCAFVTSLYSLTTPLPCGPVLTTPLFDFYVVVVDLRVCCSRCYVTDFRLFPGYVRLPGDSLHVPHRSPTYHQF